MKIAVVQINAGSNKKQNIEKALKLTQKAIKNKAKLICLPEVFNYRGRSSLNVFLKDVAENIPGESTSPFIELAKKKKVFVLLGSLCERIKEKKKAYNTSVFIDDKGRISAKYRKINLFNAAVGKGRANESKSFVPGKRLSVAKAGNIKIGLSICYDLRFSNIYQQYAKKGCHVIAIPSSFTKTTGEAHWESLLRARAIENFCYIVAPNQTGKNGRGVLTYGNSMIIDPWGKVLARASSTSEGIIYGNIKNDEPQRIKKIFFK